MTAEDEYPRRLGQQQARAARAAVADVRLGTAKLAIAAALLALAWLAWISHLLRGAWLWLPFLGLVALFVAHDRVLRARRRADRLVDFYRQGQARLEDHWCGLGPSGDRFRAPDHAYAADLDLFGAGGLFDLVCRARTAIAQERLAAWMLAPAPPDEIRRRQAQVQALRGQLDLREDIAALGQDLDQSLEPARLRVWAQTPPRLLALGARLAYAGIAVVAVVLAIYGCLTGQFAYFFLLVLGEALLLFRLRPRLAPALAGRGANGEGLRLFAGVLDRIPGRTTEGGAALRRLARLSDWIEASDSLLGRVLDYTVLYSVQLAYAADAWRKRYGAPMASWLDAVAEFEALLSLASLAFERPEDPFPEVVEAPEPCFEAEALGHPLLPATTCVRNSVRLDSATRLLLVSGSNMSGKSTLLRAIGVNAVLAQMGAPVRVQRLRLTPLALGTCLHTADSLQLGRSGFYAEILRLRQVFDLTAGPLPVLFLFDELLEGTNSHDRVLGARGLLRALLVRPTLGLVTTHDLALTGLAAEDSRARNVHFEDQIEGNDVRFDHHLRDGVVAKSNALALMRIIGLGV